MEDIDNADTGADLTSALQVILSEKRTSMAMLRTGIAVLVLPMSVVSFLVATSRMYDALNMGYLIVPLLSLAAFLVLFSGYLILRSVLKLHRYDRMLKHLQRQHPWLAELF